MLYINHTYEGVRNGENEFQSKVKEEEIFRHVIYHFSSWVM